MANRIVFGVIQNCCHSNPLARFYSKKAVGLTAHSIKKIKKVPQSTRSLEEKKISVEKKSIPTPIEIIEDPKLLEDMIRFYKDPQKHSGK